GGGGRAEMLYFEAAVNGVAALGEEDGVRHRRVVPLLGVVILLHPESLEATVRCRTTSASRGDRPGPACRTVDADGHALRCLVDRDQDLGVGSRRGKRGNERDD